MKAQRLYLYGIALSLSGMIFGAQAQPLVVHEWGTFTSLQDEAGRTLGGINSDDEPVPAFCHDVAWWLVSRPSDLPPVASKGVAWCNPDVTMRLETPVLYFHLPAGAACPLTASVKVAFRGRVDSAIAEPTGRGRSVGTRSQVAVMPPPLGVYRLSSATICRPRTLLP